MSAGKKISSQVLYRMASEARGRAHAPYSHFQVGAAILLSTGEVFGGCNVENASYGATVCAERVATWKAISEKGPIQITEVAVVTDAAEAWPPCGMCRQVLAEFASADTLVHLGNLQGLQRSLKFSELFPLAFRADSLKS